MKNNMEVEGESLPLFARLAARALPILAKTILPGLTTVCFIYAFFPICTTNVGWDYKTTHTVAD